MTIISHNRKNEKNVNQHYISVDLLCEFLDFVRYWYSNYIFVQKIFDIHFETFEEYCRNLLIGAPENEDAYFFIANSCFGRSRKKTELKAKKETKIIFGNAIYGEENVKNTIIRQIEIRKGFFYRFQFTLFFDNSNEYQQNNERIRINYVYLRPTSSPDPLSGLVVSDEYYISIHDKESFEHIFNNFFCVTDDQQIETNIFTAKILNTYCSEYDKHSRDFLKRVNFKDSTNNYCYCDTTRHFMSVLNSAMKGFNTKKERLDVTPIEVSPETYSFSYCYTKK